MFLIKEESSSGDPQYHDRRIFARLKAGVVLKYVEDEQEKTGMTLDISAQGLGIISKEGLKTDTEVRVFLKLPDTKEELSIAGKIIWCHKINDTMFRAGILLDQPELMIVSKLMNGNNS